MIKCTIGIEEDPTPYPEFDSSSKSRPFLIAIRNPKGDIVGIPARSLTNAQALMMLHPLKYAAEYAMRETLFQVGMLRLELVEMKLKEEMDEGVPSVPKRSPRVRNAGRGGKPGGRTPTRKGR